MWAGLNDLLLIITIFQRDALWLLRWCIQNMVTFTLPSWNTCSGGSYATRKHLWRQGYGLKLPASIPVGRRLFSPLPTFRCLEAQLISWESFVFTLQWTASVQLTVISANRSHHPGREGELNFFKNILLFFSWFYFEYVWNGHISAIHIYKTHYGISVCKQKAEVR